MLTFVAACTHARPPIVCVPTAEDAYEPPAVLVKSFERSGFRIIPCEGSPYGMVSSGSREARIEELTAWKKRIEVELAALPGISGFAIVGCCSSRAGGASKEECLEVQLRRGSRAEEKLAEFLQRTRADANLGDARVRVDVHSFVPLTNECDANDPNCGPIPYERDLCRVPSSRSWHRDAVTKNVFPEEVGGSCTHDGDCNACISTCKSRREIRYCSAAVSLALTDAYCGCLEGQCRWFKMHWPFRRFARDEVE